MSKYYVKNISAYLSRIGLRRVDATAIHGRVLLLLLLLGRPAVSVRAAEVSLRLAMRVAVVRVLLVQCHVLLLMLHVLLVHVLLLLHLLLAQRLLLLLLHEELLLLLQLCLLALRLRLC